jgi:iron-sulfur cluster assembly protein
MSAQDAAAEGVQITEKAREHILSAMLTEDAALDGGVRLEVEGGGCSRVLYNVTLNSQPRDRDRIFDCEGIRVLLDPKAFVYLNGSMLDWEETQRRFVFSNPKWKKNSD